jgi:hypothetical protein
VGHGNRQEFFMTKHWKTDRAHVRMPTLESLRLAASRKQNHDVAIKHGALGAGAVGAGAVGALALGAIGAIAIGAMAIKHLAIKRARIERLSVGTLEVDHLVNRKHTGPGALDTEAI